MAVRQPRARVFGEGLTAVAVATGLAWCGVRVSCARPDRAVVEHEPWLPEVLRCLHRSGTLSYGELAAPDAVFVCGADQVRAPAGSAVINCVLPPWESTRDLQKALGRPVVSNPQQLREGSALEDFLGAGCQVLGADDAESLVPADVVLSWVPVPPLHCDVDSADLVPHAIDGLLAVEREFFDELTELCRAVGADEARVVECVRADPRIGPDPARDAEQHPQPRWRDPARLFEAHPPPVLAELGTLR
ncbi:hypothetical protein EIL87_20780 [Saccharopolyspora rhizosphaerae]|uniref:UDP-glucose/GDP-mannose dehydrogenase N-terminal domain-containing protein n=1 Tax=Saccharopolyspora rhizosphaerae TaxID=2492662 RepID=A0A426JLZ4_9PSEU|nr:hypothetical protein [Saccharopolyspora rhizosphaerae]RRO14186.1 hypothetical protein EIL87_20780 [Saccharopolyspora rhizosphaerae]